MKRILTVLALASILGACSETTNNYLTDPAASNAAEQVMFTSVPSYTITLPTGYETNASIAFVTNGAMPEFEVSSSSSAVVARIDATILNGTLCSSCSRTGSVSIDIKAIGQTGSSAIVNVTLKSDPTKRVSIPIVIALPEKG